MASDVLTQDAKALHCSCTWLRHWVAASLTACLGCSRPENMVSRRQRAESVRREAARVLWVLLLHSKHHGPLAVHG